MSGRHSTKKKVAAYIGMPLLYCVLTLATLIGVYFLALDDLVSPFLKTMFVSADTQTDTSDIVSIYDGPVDEEQQADTVDGTLVKIPFYGNLYGEIRCDRIGFQADLYFGDSPEVLRKGAGQTMQSTIPGFGYPTMVSGHNNRAFNHLQHVQEGDEFVLHTSYGTYRYRVSGTEVINAADFQDSLLVEERERLILYTCYPFDMLGLTPKRFFVYAEKISGPTVVFPEEGGATE